MPLHGQLGLRCFVGPSLTKMKELTAITFITNGGATRVDTLEGLSGFSWGGGACLVQLESAIPNTGQEFPYQQYVAEHTLVPIQIPCGAEGSFVGMGMFIDTTMAISTGTPANQSINWDGELSKIE